MNIESKTLPNGYRIVIEVDPDPESPRDWDNAFTMAFFHRRYDLGDKEFKTVGEFEAWKKKNKNQIAFIAPVRMYDHSGITISMSADNQFGYPYTDRWDSGLLGFIFITKKKAKQEWGKDATPENLQKWAEGEIKTYDQYLRGSVYGFRILDPDGEEVDSCWGHYCEPEEIIKEQEAAWKDKVFGKGSMIGEVINQIYSDLREDNAQPVKVLLGHLPKKILQEFLDQVEDK
jgi:hypothetical protein